MEKYNAVAESNNFIILDKYEKISQPYSHQTEAELEREFIQDLVNLGYEYSPEIKTPSDLLKNLRVHIQNLNSVEFSNSEWKRFLEEYLDKPNETIVERTAKIHGSESHKQSHIKDFVFDDGHVQNVYIVDKENISRNKVQVISQFEQTGLQANRYDVTILVNGLPLVHVELKKRGVAIREAFNQIHRYSKESFNSDSSLFKYIQIFVISNGTDTRYFANTVSRSKNSFDFTMNWARVDNTLIKDLKDFTATFFQKKTVLSVLLKYSVFDQNSVLLIMRPYQIAATERILWKIVSSHNAKSWSKPEAGGYVWHTTGSGKTLTSFKAAQLATRLDFIKKVFFVVDRKDLDYQTMKEYQRFAKDSVNGSNNTTELKLNIEKDDNRIIVTTIQKLNTLMRSDDKLPIYDEEVVFIFDEAHRSQFGEAQRNLKKKFKKYYQFGFTGTPIFLKNANGDATTPSVFGQELHSYVITDAIRDDKVLKFKVDYNNVSPEYKGMETETDDEKIDAFEDPRWFLHPNRINKITSYILKNFDIKTHRTYGNKGFNAMFAVSSVNAAKLYYDEFKRLQAGIIKPLRVATIFSYADNEKSRPYGEIADENFEPTVMNDTSKDFLKGAIEDYNAMFKTSFSIDSASFQNYYKDLAKRVRDGEVDLLIVVGMFLTGFDAQKLNTLFVDKNLRYHGLIQAYSRTNRIYDSTKAFGNIVTFRDLEKHTIDAITLFGNSDTQNLVIERSYKDWLFGFVDFITGHSRRGYIDIVNALKCKFPDPGNIETEEEKKDLVKTFGEYLRIVNILSNYDEFTVLKEFKKLDADDAEVLEAFKSEYHLTDEDIEEMRQVDMPSDRMIDNYTSAYNDIRDWRKEQREAVKFEEQSIAWDDVEFEIDLLKSQEINLDYILGLIFEHKHDDVDKSMLIEEVRLKIRASGNRAKEGLIIDFINNTDLGLISNREDIIEAFFAYAKVEKEKEASALIREENLIEQEAKRYIEMSLRREYASENGTDLISILPKMSPLNPNYLTKKQNVFRKISAFVEKYKGVGGSL